MSTLINFTPIRMVKIEMSDDNKIRCVVTRPP